MNDHIAADFIRIREIGKQIADLSAEAKRLRKSLGSSYQCMQKMPDGKTGVVYLPDLGEIGMIAPPIDPECRDWNVTFSPCSLASKDAEAVAAARQELEGANA